MYPLLPAMKGVHAELISQVMQELAELYREDQVSLAQQFSWMSILLERTSTVTDLEKSRIEERLNMFDQLWNESPRVQQMKKQFREEAQKEAEKKAEQDRKRLQQEAEQDRKRFQREAEQKIEQERLKIRRSNLVRFIRARFPDLADFAQQQVEQLDQPAALDLLIQQVAVAPDANAVRFALNAGAQ
jgi:F0F1-type ATP synthase membrane subunit b/b'